ncbi:hypothetical protein ACFW1P_04390 [Paenibacillus sp. NPDC058910]|uniref:hypothetical protein n=1 Tax=Paenibacillus sp. NPDC058910 TaxID=3346670 RepID=UPI0036912BF6
MIARPQVGSTGLASVNMLQVKQRLYLMRLQLRGCSKLGWYRDSPFVPRLLAAAMSLGKEGVICLLPAGDEEKAGKGAYAQRAEETLKPLP